MTRSSGTRKTASLSDSVQHQLNMYALAASAAGVGMLALVQPVKAEIVYTRAHVVIPEKTIRGLDLNHDGVNDFSLSNYFRTFGSSYQDALTVKPATGNAVWGQGAYASALRAGVRIGPKGPFGSHDRMAFIHIACEPACTETTTRGPWTKGTNRNLGLRFVIQGQNHYGWARLKVEVTPSNRVTLILLGYAYETVANKPIRAGEVKGQNDVAEQINPSALTRPVSELGTLGLLALGSPGPSVWRREETVGTKSDAK